MDWPINCIFQFGRKYDFDDLSKRVVFPPKEANKKKFEYFSVESVSFRTHEEAHQ